MARLSGKKVAILVDNNFEENEMIEPLKALKKEGAKIDIVAAEPDNREVQGLFNVEKGHKYKIDKTLAEANIEDYDALVLPGGAVNCDNLRIQNKAIKWVKEILSMEKPLAVMCHAQWVLASAGVANGRRLTSYPTIKDDLINAGADWLDEEVVIDGTLITSRRAADMTAFNKALTILLS